jgi:Fe2+ or Zn2+ uptake regulation protein
MTTPPERTQRLAERLREAGLRVTGPRLAILGILERDATHPSAVRLFEYLRKTHPSLSLSTVYKTLEAFMVTGLCRRVGGDGSRLRVDGMTERHAHAACERCGEIFDVDCELHRLPPAPRELPGGHSVTGVRLEYDVVCARCQGSAASSPTESTNDAALEDG